LSFRLEFRSRARRRLAKLAKRNLQIAKDIHAKLTWLTENAEDIDHERLQGREEYSLHCGQYRIPYLLNRADRVICIEDIGKHDEAYRRLGKR
jgi:mRNA-degrading endonuclease RelE of RelBE toxin-antitoxin system